MNRRLGMSLPSFSNPTTRSSSLYSTCCPPFLLYLVPPPSCLFTPPATFPSSLPYTSTPTPYVHHAVSDPSSNHRVPSVPSICSRSAPTPQPAFQGFESAITYVSVRLRQFIPVAHLGLRLAQSSPFNRSPQSSPSRAVTNDSPDDFQTNAASGLALTPSAQQDSTIPPNVYINGLPPNFPEEQLYNMTKEFGPVLSVRTFTRHVSERPT